MSTYATVYNTTRSPVVVDDEGRTVAAGSWGSVRRRTDVVRAAVDSGRLIVVDRPDGDLNPEAEAAFAATDEGNGPSPAVKRQAQPDETTKES